MSKKIFITGVASGIGHALAKHYLDQHFEVYGLSRRKPEDLTEYPNFAFECLDLQNVEQIHQSLSALLEGNRDLDLVVLNAGVAGKIGDNNGLALSDYTQVMTINVWANKLILDCLFLLGINIRQVVAITSHAGVSGFRGTGPYCVSKAALNMLISVYAMEKTRTHFSLVAPPLVDTAMQQDVSTNTDNRFPVVNTLREARRRGLMLTPDDAAQLLSRYFQSALSEPSGTLINAAEFNQLPCGFADGLRRSIKDFRVLLTQYGR